LPGAKKRATPPMMVNTPQKWNTFFFPNTLSDWYAIQSESPTTPSVQRLHPYVHSGLGWTCTRPRHLICIPVTNWRSAHLRSAHELFSQSSHSFERGAVRFLLWWLFLHRRLRSGNEAQLASSYFCAPSAGPLQRVPLVFIRVARESLATFSSWTFRFWLSQLFLLIITWDLIKPTKQSPHVMFRYPMLMYSRRNSPDLKTLIFSK
jgi:hypothetical protein